MNSRRVILAGAAGLAGLVFAGVMFAILNPPEAPPARPPAATSSLGSAPSAPPAVKAREGVSWAMVDLGSDEGIGSDDTTRHRAGAMLADLGRPAEVLAVCPVDEVAPETSWSASDLSAMAAARIGACLARGTGGLDIPAEWRASWGWDIPEATRPAITLATATAAVQEADGTWHTGCLALGETWTLAVLATYPDASGAEYGPDACRATAAELAGYLGASRAPLAAE